MRTIDELPTPALLLDLDVLERNLRWMAERAGALGVRLRPHIKTHKCVEIALGQRALGAEGITVSTLAEARVFAEAGFDDVTWAFPLVPGRLDEAAELARTIRLGITVDGAEAVDAVGAADAPFRVWIEVDVGSRRCGVDPASDAPVRLAEQIVRHPSLELAGLLCHSGAAYRARSRGQVLRLARRERDLVTEAADRLRAAGLPVRSVSVGSTPAMARVDHLEGVDEARPGNYALFDGTQVALGSCGPADCAATVLATVVSSRSDAGRSVVDAGALALSMDPGPGFRRGPHYGSLYEDYDRGILRRGTRLVSLSQEHGVLSEALPVGTRVRVLPNHSCLAVACFDAFFVVRGPEVLDVWRIRRER